MVLRVSSMRQPLPAIRSAKRLTRVAVPETEHEWVLPLEKSKKPSTRLHLRVQAGEGDTDLECVIAFAGQECLVGGAKVAKTDD